MAGGPRLSKAKAGQAKTSAPVAPMTSCAVSRSEMRPNGSKRRGFAVGGLARRSRDGDGKIAAPVGPVTGCAGFCAAKTELKTRRRAYERENCKKRQQQNSGAGRRSRGREADGRTGGSHAAKCRARFCAANPKGGAGNRPARFRAAKWSRTATSAALLHAGQTSARRAGRGFRGMRTETEGRCRNDIG